jgi:chemotaxis protein MotB
VLASQRRKRAVDEKPEGLDRWLLTYADMITLLMAFFIMVYSMSVLNVSKFRQAAISIRSGFRGLAPGQGRSLLDSSPLAVGDTAGIPWKKLRPVVEFIEHQSRDGAVTISEDERGIIISMSSDSLLFEPGSADVRTKAQPYLEKIARMLRSTKNEVRVEGHTCDLPPRGSRFATNWELSTARATGVLRRLVEQEKLPAERISAAGYGSMKPVVPNDSASNRAKNRRVEIIILRPEITAAFSPKDQPRRVTDPFRAAIQRR